MERILSRESEETQNCIAIDKFKVGIIGISNSVGVSFLTGCLARFLANLGNHSPAVAEFGRGSLLILTVWTSALPEDHIFNSILLWRRIKAFGEKRIWMKELTGYLNHPMNR